MSFDESRGVDFIHSENLWGDVEPGVEHDRSLIGKFSSTYLYYCPTMGLFPIWVIALRSIDIGPVIIENFEYVRPPRSHTNYPIGDQVMRLNVENKMPGTLNIFVTPVDNEITWWDYFKEGQQLLASVVKISKSLSDWKEGKVKGFPNLYGSVSTASEGLAGWEVARKFIYDFDSLSTDIAPGEVLDAVGDDYLNYYVTKNGLSALGKAKWVNVHLQYGDWSIDLTQSPSNAAITVSPDGASSSDGMSYPWTKSNLLILSDAICYNSRSKKYWFFNGTLCWSKKYGDQKKVSEPSPIATEFLKAPTGSDAICYNNDSNKYWFFKGAKCWSKAYGDSKETEGPFEISTEFIGAPADLDAACYCSTSSTYWFFKGAKCWSKAYGDSKETVGPFEISTAFVGAPADATTVCYNPDSRKYWFFRLGYCWSKSYGNTQVTKGPWLIDDEFDYSLGKEPVGKTEL